MKLINQFEEKIEKGEIEGPNTKAHEDTQDGKLFSFEAAKKLREL